MISRREQAFRDAAAAIGPSAYTDLGDTPLANFAIGQRELVLELTKALRELILWCPRGWSLELDQSLTTARKAVIKAEGGE